MAAAPEIGDPRGERLDSWKAIARHLGRDIRSVQRWERERGLPVHRVPGDKGGAVFAYVRELERWLLSRSSPGPSASAEPRSGWKRLAWITAAVLALAVGALAFVLQPFASGRPDTERRLIAVLPLRNLSGDASQDYFADGFTEELVTELAQLRSLRVVSSASTKVYKGSGESPVQIAKALHARLILQGTVARQRDRVRVTAQLIDGTNGSLLSAETYGGDLKDVFDIQRRIAQAIASDVRLDLSRVERDRLTTSAQVDPQALDLYLRGRFQFAMQTPDSIRESLSLFEASAARDPRFARAYVGIAEAEAALLQITAQGPDDTLRRERQALAQALALDPDLGEARGLLASLDYWFDWDWPRAEREFRLALSQGAGASTEQRFGSALVTRGRFDEGMAHLQAALELDPLGLSPRVNQFFGLYFERRYAEARRQMEATLAGNPAFVAGHALFGLDAVMQRDCTEAARQAKWMGDHDGSSSLSLFLLAIASSCRGDGSAARAYLDQAGATTGKTFISPYQLALGYASLDEPATALDYLERSAAEHEPQILYLKVEPFFDSLRSEPRFTALERRVGLAD